jgi:hypothetical protein
VAAAESDKVSSQGSGDHAEDAPRFISSAITIIITITFTIAITITITITITTTFFIAYPAKFHPNWHCTSLFGRKTGACAVRCVEHWQKSRVT